LGADREYPRRPIVGVGAVVLMTPDEASSLGARPAANPGVVLVKRRFEPLRGEWTLPGGIVDPGETLAAAIARELTEEIGLTVAVGPIVAVLDRIMPDAEGRTRYHFVLIDFLCRPTGGELRAGSDVEDVAIADPDDLDAFAVDNLARTVIRDAISAARASAASEPRERSERGEAVSE
jgi:ADP-ribose pyrophosphatase YjhB (NUDIX family)